MNEQKPRWGKGAVVLIAAAVVFLLAAGTFGTLWILERNDHSTTAEQLTGERARAEKVKTTLKDAEDRRKAVGDKVQDTVTRERTQEVVRDKYKNCADAGRDFTAAMKTRDNPRLERASLSIDIWCV